MPPLPRNAPYYALPSEHLSLIRDWVRASRSVKRPLIKVEQIPLYVSDVQLMLGQGWLNDEIINAHNAALTLRWRLLQQQQQHQFKESEKEEARRPPFRIFSTFFYTKLVDDGYGAVRRWTRRDPLWAFERVIVPLNFGNTHWATAVFDLRNRCIVYLDSMGSYRAKRIHARLLEYITLELIDKPPTDADLQRSPWLHDLFEAMQTSLEQPSDKKAEAVPLMRLIVPRGTPQQGDGESCGIFCCLFAREAAAIKGFDPIAQEDEQADHLEEYHRNRFAPTWGQAEASHYRKRMAYDMIQVQQAAMSPSS